MSNHVFLLLGSNLGNRKQLLVDAITHIKTSVGKICLVSGLYETAAWGKTDQPPFLNQVIEVNTNLTPEDLLATIQEIENKMGRIRYEKWGERLIDIDILYFNDLIIDRDRIIIPHPEIAKRRFTLEPLSEIAPEFINPVLKKSNQELLKECEDALKVMRL